MTWGERVGSASITGAPAKTFAGKQLEILPTTYDLRPTTYYPRPATYYLLATSY